MEKYFAGLAEKIISLEKQLAEREKLLLLAKEALASASTFGGFLSSVAEKAIAVINDSKAIEGLVLCDAEPVGKYTGTEGEYGYQIVQLDCDIEVGTKLYKAKEKS
jgi:hypothetical protein